MINLVEYFLAKNAGGGGGGGADISTATVFIANFWLDEIVLVNGSIDPQAQYIYTV